MKTTKVTKKSIVLILGILTILVIFIILYCVNPEILTYDITQYEAPVNPHYYGDNGSLTLLQRLFKSFWLKVGKYYIPVYIILICSLVGLITALVEEIKRHKK